MFAAVSRPLRNLEKMCRQAPGGVGFKQAILQNEILRVLPVIGDVAAIVVTHHIRLGGDRTRGVVVIQTATPPAFGLRNEAVHPAAIHILHGVASTMRAAAISVARIVIRFRARLGRGIVYAYGGFAMAHGNAVGARKRPEVAVERTVFLHDHDHVADLANAAVVLTLHAKREGQQQDGESRLVHGV